MPSYRARPGERPIGPSDRVTNRHQGDTMNRMIRAVAGTVCVLSSLYAIAATAADPLPKSGIIDVHSGYWAVSENVAVAEKHSQGHGSNRGVIYNDRGSGPFHLGPTDCFFT
jgi:hypothetical protein